MPTLLEGSALDQQLQLFEQQVDGLSARVDEDDLVSVVNLGLAIFQQIRRLEDRIARGASPIDSKKIEQARSVANLYTHWYQSASILRKIIKSRTGADWTILANDINRACDHARVPALHFDDLLRLETGDSLSR